MKRKLLNRTTLGVTLIFAALIVCFGLMPLYNSQLQALETVVRLTAPVEKGTLLTENHLAEVTVGGYGLTEDTVKDLQAAVGKYAQLDMVAGDTLMAGKLGDTPPGSSDYLANLDDRMAMSIGIKSFASGLSGKLEPGDIVSVVCKDQSGNEIATKPKSLGYVEVLAVTNATGADKKAGSGSEVENEKDLPVTVTLAVDELQAKELAAQELEGSLYLTLVYRGNSEVAAQFLSIQKSVNEELTLQQSQTNPAQ